MKATLTLGVQNGAAVVLRDGAALPPDERVSLTATELAEVLAFHGRAGQLAAMRGYTARWRDGDTMRASVALAARDGHLEADGAVMPDDELLLMSAGTVAQLATAYYAAGVNASPVGAIVEAIRAPRVREFILDDNGRPIGATDRVLDE